ncbi:MAG: HAMP domain-containing protein [Anaerolineaceae bacterium]|nr:HAMP domain-containing protein [Anaerolineaceae bacterium]
MRKGSLQSQITSSFLLVVLLTISFFSIMTYVMIRQRFKEMTYQSGQNFVERNVSIFTYYFETNNGWLGIDEFFFNNPHAAFKDIDSTEERFPWIDRKPPSDENKNIPPSPDRLILFTADGEMIFDSDPSEGEIQISNEAMKKAIPIVVNEVEVGKLISANSAGLLRREQLIFIQDIFWTLLASTIVSVLVVVVVSLFLTRRILNPVNSLSVASLKIANGDFTQRVDVHEDNELGEMATAFNTMTVELDRQNNLRRRATSDIAHELRTPLSVLQIELEALEDGLSDPTPDTLQGLQREVAYLNHLVEDLRILALAESGDMMLDPVKLDMGVLASEMAVRVRHAAQEKNINVLVHNADQVYLLEADELRVSQIFFNLLSNAIQYTPENGQIDVYITEDEDYIVTTVQDTGMGIPESDLAHVFERLYRTSQARTRTNGGSGLGLSIVKGLVDMHHGEIWVESEDGKGSCFIFKLPKNWKEKSD